MSDKCQHRTYAPQQNSVFIRSPCRRWSLARNGLRSDLAPMSDKVPDWEVDHTGMVGEEPCCPAANHAWEAIMVSRRFIQCDVFTSVPTKGNGLAVVVDG